MNEGNFDLRSVDEAEAIDVQLLIGVTTADELATFLAEHWSDSVLDEDVHEAKASEAADINNSGMVAQIEYLADGKVPGLALMLAQRLYNYEPSDLDRSVVAATNLTATASPWHDTMNTIEAMLTSMSRSDRNDAIEALRSRFGELYDREPASGIEVDRMVTLSTGHLPEAIRDDLNGFMGVTADRTAYGWQLFVPDNIDQAVTDYGIDDGEGIPQSVVDLWRFAQQQGCSYVRLDRDGPTVPELPTYEDNA